MKLNVNRETTIGLSVLLVLLVILGVVAVRRFMRPTIPLEEVIARVEEKPAEERREHHAQREADLSKPALLTPADTPHHDSLKSLDEPGRWDVVANPAPQHSPAGRGDTREKPASSAEAGLIAADPPALSGLPANAEPDRGRHEPARTYASAEATPSADRYAATTTAPAPELRTRPSSGLTVIQASGGEPADAAPRHHDRYAADGRGQPDQPGPGLTAGDTPPAPAVVQQVAPSDGPATGMPADPEAARRHAEKAREREFQGDGPPVHLGAAREPYVAAPPPIAPAPRSGYDPTSPAAGNPSPNYASAPAGDAAANYPAAPGGFGRENVLRRGDEIPGRGRTQERLRDDGMYEVQPNDSYWTISERVYGSGSYFRALAEQNRGKAARPDRLPPGLVISTPPIAQLEKDYPDLCPRPNRRDTGRNRGDPSGAASLTATAGGGRIYVVQEGDTLTSIARYELGKISRWAEIVQLNREALGKDYDYLKPGMKLVLPIRDFQSHDRTTRRADDGVPLLR